MSTDLELGRLISAVDTLSKEVTTLREQMQDLTSKVNTGKGMFFGALFAAGGAGAGMSALFHRIFP